MTVRNYTKREREDTAWRQRNQFIVQNSVFEQMRNRTCWKIAETHHYNKCNHHNIPSTANRKEIFQKVLTGPRFRREPLPQTVEFPENIQHADSNRPIYYTRDSPRPFPPETPTSKISGSTRMAFPGPRKTTNPEWERLPWRTLASESSHACPALSGSWSIETYRLTECSIPPLHPTTCLSCWQPRLAEICRNFESIQDAAQSRPCSRYLEAWWQAPTNNLLNLCRRKLSYWATCDTIRGVIRNGVLLSTKCTFWN